ncbi:hypothetical protein E8E11_007245 [Didymella keratinophila]|nr:hypothetical protein E8E11_007245 [Didymella keratinophila]
MLSQRIFAALALFCRTFSKPTSDNSSTYLQAGLPLVTHNVAQLSSVPTWLENIAVRNNGDLLVTQFAPAPVLYTVRNPSLPNATLESTYDFKTTANILGIAEIRPDTFIIVGGNATANATGYVGTFSAWEVKFSKVMMTVHKIVDVPEAMFLNGVVARHRGPTHITRY